MKINDGTTKTLLAEAPRVIKTFTFFASVAIAFDRRLSTSITAKSLMNSITFDLPIVTEGFSAYYKTQWYDQQADVVRDYRLFYLPFTSAVEMFDCKTQRMFFKRKACPEINAKDLFIGSTVTVFARQLKLVDYGDVFTR